MRSADGLSDPAAPTPSAETVDSDAAFTGFFERWYAPVVGLVRRCIDPGDRSSASLVAAEQIAVEAFAELRHSLGEDAAADVARLVVSVADRSIDSLVGHPGSVPLHYEILGPDIDFDGELPLGELHHALTEVRRWDARVGVLALAGALSPAQVATLLRRPLDEVLERLGRVCTRLADGRRVGLTDDQRATA